MFVEWHLNNSVIYWKIYKWRLYFDSSEMKNEMNLHQHQDATRGILKISR